MKIHHKSKRALPPLPQVAELINKLANTPNDDLAQVISEIPTWKWPRSDLNAWVKVLNKFDTILEEVIRDYEVDKLQINVFTPLTKKTVCEILRFERMLLENSTNRKTFNSYDRLNSLMLTSDLDVLVLTLTLILRPSQQYSAQPSVAQALNISTHRLQCLTKRWSNLRECGVNLVDLVTEKGKQKIDTLPPDARDISFSFYRQEAAQEKSQESQVETDISIQDHTTPKKASASTHAPPPPQSGAVSILIERHALQAKPDMHVLADTIETYSMPDDAKFDLMCRIRTAQVLTYGKEVDREKLVIVRLLAIAIFCHTHNEPQGLTALFLPEPDLINHIAELLQLDRGVPINVQTAAILALDAAARYRNKIQEVLTAVNAGVNHGTLMSLLRKTVADVASKESTLPHSFVEALLALVTFLASHAAGGNMVVAAGLIPLLIQVIDNRLPDRLLMVSKTMQLVDNVLYGFTNAFQLFCNNRGVDALVDRIEYEVDYDIEEYGGNRPSHQVPVSYGKLPVSRAAVLKHILRSMHRMMQTSGTSEGLRGLIDSSLLKSIKKVIEARALFGPSILPFAINIMATFVHNEPTSLTIIQEAGLPEVFYRIVESGVEPAFEVIQAIPNAIGALCLNQTGQDQLAARPTIIPGLFSIFTSERHQRVLQDKENAVLVGTSIDELIRHHPFLKAPVFEAVRSTLGRIEDLGNAYVVPPEIRHWYQLVPESGILGLGEISTEVEVDVVMDIDLYPTAASSGDAGINDDAASESAGEKEDPSGKMHDNHVVSFIDVVGRFLEGLFQHPHHCKDFVTNTDGLERIGRLTALPCLPYDFANSVASDSLVQVIRTMVEAATGETLGFLAKLVRQSLTETEEFWNSKEQQSNFSGLVDVPSEQLDHANQRWRNMVTLNIRTTMLSDLYSTAGYAPGRASANLLQALIGRGSPGIIPDLGRLHRACIWENIVFKNALQVKGEEAISFGASLGSGDSGLESTTPIQDIPSIDGAAANGDEMEADQSVLPSGLTSPKKEEKKEDTPRSLNAKALTHVLSQIPSSLAPLFQSVVKLFYTRRVPDATTKQRILDASALVADMILGHLAPREFDNKLCLYTYYTVMLGLLSVLMVDERTTQPTLHTVLVVALTRIGGLDAIFHIIHRFMDSVNEISAIKYEDRSEEAKDVFVHAFGGLKVALHLIHPLISSKPLLEANQTTFLVHKDRTKKDAEFEPHDFLVKLRLAALPVLHEIWNSKWLVAAPLSVCKSAVQTVLELLNKDGEEAASSGGGTSGGDPPSTAAARQPPDENRIHQLTDMGFQRAAAERALLRTHNSVPAAADLLLSQPFMPVIETDVYGTGAATPDAETQPVAEPEAQDPGPWESAVEKPSSAAEHDESTPEDRRTELNAAREIMAGDMPYQALRLLDEHSTLVFDVHRAFTATGEFTQERSIHLLIDDIKAFSPSAYDIQEQPLAVRCRLLAIIFADVSPAIVRRVAIENRKLMDDLLALLLSDSMNGDNATPKWLAPHLLVAETLLTLGDEPRQITLPKSLEDDIPNEELFAGPSFQSARSILFDFCVRLLSNYKPSRDEQLSCLRLLVVLTRDHDLAARFVKQNGVELLLQCLRTKLDASSMAGHHSYITTIIRHVAEDQAAIQHIMKREVKRFIEHPRNRALDATNYVRNCSAMALRDPKAFIQATDDSCQLFSPFTGGQNINAKKSSSPVDVSEQKTTEKTAGDSEMQIDEQVPPAGAMEFSDSLEATIHFLINELMKMAKSGIEQLVSVPISSPPDPTKTLAAAVAASASNSDVFDVAVVSSSAPAIGDTNNEASEGPEGFNNYAYTCFLMQVLTELLFSYDSCKLAFLSFSPKKRTQTPAKDVKYRTAALQFFLTDLVSFGTINSQPTVEARRRIMLCNWAMSVVVALCVDTSAGHDLKDVPADLVSVRKFVLEAISRSIKDLSLTGSIDSRYSRLLALTDLCYRLLTVRFNVGARKSQDEIPTHIAKVMLEKNFVATLTNALGDIDLNYPNIRAVVTSVLKPMEYLTKVAIKMSRASGKTKDSIEEKEQSPESSDHEDISEEPREETPDFYRNSSLGMYGGEMEDVHYGPEDTMEEDEVDDDEDVEMDFADDTGSDDSSRTEDEDGDDGDEDVDADTGDSEGAWQDDDDDEEDLVENDGGQGDDGEDDGDDDDDDEQGDEPVVWAEADTAPEPEDGEDEEELGGTVPIVRDEQGDDEEWMSDGNEFADELGVLEARDNAPQFASIFNIAGAFGENGEGGNRGVQQVIWTGGRRAVSEETDVFGRPGNVPSAPEATTHPLLLDVTSQRPGPTRVPRRLHRGISDIQPQDLIATLENIVGGNNTVQFIQHLMSHVRTSPGGDAIHVDVPPGALVQMDPQLLNQRHRGHISAAIRVERASRPGDPRREERDFNPLGSIQRWSEEAKILHGKYASERLTKLADHVVLRLLPAGVAVEKELKAAREKELAEIREAEAKVEEDKAEEVKPDEDLIEEAAEGPALIAEQDSSIEQPSTATTEELATVQPDDDTEMIDAPGPGPSVPESAPIQETAAESSDAAPNAAVSEEGEPSAPAARVTIMIHGSSVDITETGIDPTFLEALPDDMREEVINQHVRDQRAARIERPADSQISTEFLDALPPDIRAEILQQERAEQIRRRTEEANQTRGPTAPAELDNADFIASLDPQLREVVLLDQDDGFIRTLPSHMIAEAQGYREGSHRHHRHRTNLPSVRTAAPLPRPVFTPRDAIQLLDKNSISTLVRLLFFPQVLKKNILLKVLLHLCENSKTRTELFNVLLSILQDGSGDVAAMDKSFAHMSVRNTKPPSSKAAGKQKVVDNLGGVPLPNDIVPEFRARRCLEALTFIVSSNELSSLFFLTEHELPAGLRKAAAKKGKGKEKQASPTHYPIVMLLSLLDRQSLLRTSSTMESVVGLLASVTRPLTSLKDTKIVEAAQPTVFTSQPQADSAETSAAPVAMTTDEPSTAPSQTAPAPPATSEESKPEETADGTEEKALLATPPVIPQQVLRSIVNILTVGECSGRAFQQTLALIQHTSCIPDAQEVIAQELKLRAQEFGQTLHSDLDELARALQMSQNDALAGSAASKFSSASSDQAKLLRVLKTIDYMYSSKSPTPTSTPPTDEGSQQIQSIYETFKFSALWRRLGDCLTLIEKPELDHIATILLPLIECLMVVCKYVGPRSPQAVAARAARASASPKSSTTASESMEDLFVAFTDSHRKILNVMVRNNPSLMSGSFSLLVHNPRVLDFDNKRNYFNQQLHRRPHAREHHSTLQLNVRRPRVFEDSFQYLQRKTGDQIKHGKLSVRFYDEEGVDAGGLTREWFQILARQMFNPNYALFQPCAADRLTYQPNRASAVNPEHLSFFKFVGRVIGKAIYDGRLLDAYFAKSLYRQLLGKPVDYRDVEWVDPEYYNSLCWILENDPSPLDLNFSVEADEFGVTKIVSLKENGEKIPVTLENRKEFVQLSAQYRLYSSIKEQIESLIGGFYEIIPKDLISIFNEQEVELLISGTPDIDVDEWRAATEYNGYTSSDPVIVWWWRALKSFNREERAKVLSFATGTSRVPLGGFVDLQGVQGVQKFSIHRAYGDSDRLPQAHTCFNQIDLPQYTTYDMLRQQLLLAINEGGEGFGFA